MILEKVEMMILEKVESKLSHYPRSNAKATFLSKSAFEKKVKTVYSKGNEYAAEAQHSLTIEDTIIENTKEGDGIYIRSNEVYDDLDGNGVIRTRIQFVPKGTLLYTTVY